MTDFLTNTNPWSALALTIIGLVLAVFAMALRELVRANFQLEKHKLVAAQELLQLEEAVKRGRGISTEPRPNETYAQARSSIQLDRQQRLRSLAEEMAEQGLTRPSNPERGTKPSPYSQRTTNPQVRKPPPSSAGYVVIEDFETSMR